LFDTVQDLGRIGFMALGMPTAGAIDRVALNLAYHGARAQDQALNVTVGQKASPSCCRRLPTA
jgi:allophanate hydrolase subunit 2